LGISFFVQQLLAKMLGNAGYALVGDIRNLIPMLTSTSTLGVFNGAVKYVSEFKNNKSELVKMFSTTSVFFLFGSLISALILFFMSKTLSLSIFGDITYTGVLRFLAFMVPFIGLNRLLSSVINGLSDYKNYAKVELIAYVLSAIILVIGLYTYNIKGVLFAIAVAPLIQLLVTLIVYGKILVEFIQPKKLSFNLSYKQQLMAFTLMSFVSTFLINYIEIDLRAHIETKVSKGDAGNWTAITFISKNYMVFASGLFTLYILPKFANINDEASFKKELFNIYKNILPIFGVGMLLVYFLRFFIINAIYPDFDGMDILFKWQLLGDFVRLCAWVLAYQFLAKKLVKSFIITELLSIILFYGFSMLLITSYKTEGIVMAHFFRYIVYLVIVVIMIWHYFKFILPKQNNAQNL
jgi:PST family polysaccharide transporter